MRGPGVTPLDSGPSLIVISGTSQDRRIPVPFGGKVLGRDTQLGSPFSTDRFVSRHHVVVRRVGHGVEIADLGSANGTYINGTRVLAPTRLLDGDVLRIGRISLKLSAPGELDLAMAGGDWPRSRRRTVSPRDRQGTVPPRDRQPTALPRDRQRTVPPRDQQRTIPPRADAGHHRRPRVPPGRGALRY